MFHFSIAHGRCVALVPSPYERTHTPFSQLYRVSRFGIRYESFAALNHVALDLLATHKAYVISTHHNIMRHQIEEIKKAEGKACEQGIPYTRLSKAKLEAA
ncbi:hypothetical protein BGW39_006683 [Mortierella sp. 14UC]|nr:hypothetical protein BGW39_006683 [Mortierella sp. 14UC]